MGSNLACRLISSCILMLFQSIIRCTGIDITRTGHRRCHIIRKKQPITALRGTRMIGRVQNNPCLQLIFSRRYQRLIATVTVLNTGT